MGFMGEVVDEGKKNNGKDDDEIDNVGQPKKKARLEMAAGFRRSDNDLALDLLGEVLEAVPTPRIYLEGARFLHMRIQCLIDSGDKYLDCEGGGEEYYEYNNDVSYLVDEDKDTTGASRRHAALLDEMYKSTARKDVTSTTLCIWIELTTS